MDTKYLKYFYLNIGTGKACAMQSSVQVWLIQASVISIIFHANLGAALPIGSRKKYSYYYDEHVTKAYTWKLGREKLVQDTTR